MHPTIFPGDIIIYKPIRNRLSIALIKDGAIVIAINPRDKKNLIVKRVNKISSAGVLLMGDNKLLSTDSRHFGIISFDDIKGIVEGIIPNKFKK